MGGPALILLNSALKTNYMPVSNKPRKKYRPRARLANPMEYVLEGFAPLESAGSYLMDLKLVNHSAMTELLAGRATKKQMDSLIAMSNICEALQRMGFGEGYADVTTEGRFAILSIVFRAVEKHKFIPTGLEIQMLNRLIELHDAQMDIITVQDMEKAIDLAKKELKKNKAIRLPSLAGVEIRT